MDTNTINRLSFCNRLLGKYLRTYCEYCSYVNCPIRETHFKSRLPLSKKKKKGGGWDFLLLEQYVDLWGKKSHATLEN